MEELRYPIGKFKAPDSITSAHIQGWIRTIEDFPQALGSEVEKLSNQELEWKYRPDGWSVRQLVHHCADSHMNSQMRFKLALTEDTPTIRPYMEDRWALLPDIASPVDSSLTLLKGLHQRWAYLLKNLSPTELKKTYNHPEHNKIFSLDWTIGMYAWHCEHHLAHVRLAKASKGKHNQG